MIDKDLIEDIFPMSDISFGMVYHALQNPSEALYHDQIVFNIKMPAFDTVLFRHAVLAVMGRHGNLRSNFNVLDFDTPVQIVFKSLQPDIEHFDLRDKERSEHESFIKETLESDKLDHFALASPSPLWRIKTFLSFNYQLVVVWINHHAVIDGWSTSLVMKDLSDAYTALASKREHSFIPLKSTYKDFVKRELVVKKDPAIKQFWTRELEGVEKLQLPGMLRAGDKLQNYYPEFEENLFPDIKRAAREQNSSVKHICFAAYIYAVYMITHQTDLLVGLISHTRPVVKDAEKVVGCFLNTVPVRIQIKMGMKWKEYLQLVDRRLLEIKPQEGLSLKEINNLPGVNEYKPESLINSFFNYMDFYVYKDIRTPEEGLKEKRGRTYQPLRISSYEKTDTLLDFMLDVGSGRLNLVIRHYESVVDSSKAKDLSFFFHETIKRITRQPDEICLKENIMGGGHLQTLRQFNGTDQPYPDQKTIVDFFLEHAAFDGKDVAVYMGDQALTYDDLHRGSDQVATLLAGYGAGKGSVIMVLMERSFNMMIAIMAILKLRAIYLPADPAYPRERLNYFLEDSNVALVLTDTGIMEGNFQGRRMVSVQEALMNPRPNTVSVPRPEPGDPAYIIYTSGSTGLPKGVIVEHGALMNRINWMQSAYPLTKVDRILQKTSISFDVSVWELCWWFVAGASMVLLQPGAERNPSLIAGAIGRHAVSVIHFVPPMLDMFLECMEADDQAKEIGNLRYVFCSGEALKPNTVKAFYAIMDDVQLVNLYGPTEAAIDVTFYNCIGNEVVVPIGKPIANTNLYVLDRNEELQPVGIRGDLYIAGIGLARGYLNKPMLTAEKFYQPATPGHVRMYKTGDIARWLPSGELEFLGREDDQIKIRGFRIEAGEIEKRLLQYPGITDALVVSEPDPADGKRLHAYVAGGSLFNGIELNSFLSLHLPAYMIPACFSSVREFPKKNNGKTDRGQLIRNATVVTVVQARPLQLSQKQRLITEIWEEVLGVKTVGIADNFFQIGGNSINILKVYMRLNKSFPKKINIVDLFRYTTIGSLASYYDEKAVRQVIEEDNDEAFDMLLDAAKNLETNE